MCCFPCAYKLQEIRSRGEQVAEEDETATPTQPTTKELAIAVASRAVDSVICRPAFGWQSSLVMHSISRGLPLKSSSNNNSGAPLIATAAPISCTSPSPQTNINASSSTHGSTTQQPNKSVAIVQPTPVSPSTNPVIAPLLSPVISPDTPPKGLVSPTVIPATALSTAVATSIATVLPPTSPPITPQATAPPPSIPKPTISSPATTKASLSISPAPVAHFTLPVSSVAPPLSSPVVSGLFMGFGTSRAAPFTPSSWNMKSIIPIIVRDEEVD